MHRLHLWTPAAQSYWEAGRCPSELPRGGQKIRHLPGQDTPVMISTSRSMPVRGYCWLWATTFCALIFLPLNIIFTEIPWFTCLQLSRHIIYKWSLKAPDSEFWLRKLAKMSQAFPGDFNSDTSQTTLVWQWGLGRCLRWQHLHLQTSWKINSKVPQLQQKGLETWELKLVHCIWQLGCHVWPFPEQVHWRFQGLLRGQPWLQQVKDEMEAKEVETATLGYSFEKSEKKN